MEDKNQNKQKTTKLSPSKISERGLKFSYWYVTHKLQVKAAVVATLIVLSVGLFGYSGYRAYVLLYLEAPEYQRQLNELTQELIDYRTIQAAQGATSPKVTAFEVARSRDDTYDLVAKISNPNKQHYAKTIVVEFIADGVVVDSQTGFILPNDERYFMAFNIPLVRPNSAIVRVAEVKWRRVQFYEEFEQARQRFTVSNVEFLNSRDLGLGGDLPISSLKFKVKNESGFGFWQVGFATALFSGSGLVASNYIFVDNFESGEQRDVEIRFHENIPVVNDYEILVDIDILDPSLYMPVR